MFYIRTSHDAAESSNQHSRILQQSDLGSCCPFTVLPSPAPINKTKFMQIENEKHMQNRQVA
jgi:hypothetical protein